MALSHVTRRRPGILTLPTGGTIVLPNPMKDDSDPAYRGGYVTNTFYAAGDIMAYEGRYYRANTSGNHAEPPSVNWTVTPYPEVGVVDFLGRGYTTTGTFTNPAVTAAAPGKLLVSSSGNAASQTAATDHGSANDLVWIDSGEPRWWQCRFPTGTTMVLDDYKVRGKGPPGDNNHQLMSWNLYRVNSDGSLTLAHTQGTLGETSLWNGRWHSADPGAPVAACHGFRLEQVGLNSSGLPYMSFAEIEFFGTVAWT